MNLRYCLVLSVLLLFSISVVVHGGEAFSVRSPYDIPSPRHHGGWVADPDGYLASSTKQQVDELLTQLERKTQNEVAIAVITKMKIPEAWWAESDVAHKFSLVLFDRWKIGKAQTNNGVLFLIAVEDRKMRIQTGPGAKDILTDYECSLIIEEVKTLLRQQHYDSAVQHVAKRISSVLSGESQARTKSMGIMDMIFVGVFVLIISLFIYGCYQEYQVRNRRTSFEKRLQKLKETEVLLPQVLEGEQCGICLEDLKDKRTSRLKCKHMFHQECIGEWLERKNSCPVCRVDDPINMGPEATTPSNNTSPDASTFTYSTGTQTSYDSYDSYSRNNYRHNSYFDNILDANQYLYRDVLPYYTFNRSPNNFSWRFNQPSSASSSSSGSSGFGGGSSGGSSGGGGASGDW